MEVSSPIVLALSEELKRALTRVQELEIAENSARKEINGLLKIYSDKRTMLRTRDQEKAQSAIVSITAELEKEKKAKRRLEMENRRLLRNLGEASKALAKAEKEVDKEREAKKLMEHVCNELAKEIGEDKAEIEELKRDNARDREEIEEERRALVLIEAWREERVQMKLNEAKLQLEERCMALDKAKAELEMHLNSMKDYRVESSFKHLRGISGPMVLLEQARSRPVPCQNDFASSNDVDSHSLHSRVQSEWSSKSNLQPSDGVLQDIYSNEHVGDKFREVHINSNINFMQESDLKTSKFNGHFNYMDSNLQPRKESDCGNSKQNAHSNYIGSNIESSQEAEWKKSKVNGHVNLHNSPWIGDKMVARKAREGALHSRENGIPWENRESKGKNNSFGNHWDYLDEHRSNLEEECTESEVDEDNELRSLPMAKKQPYKLNKGLIPTLFPYIGHTFFEVETDSDGLSSVPLNSPMYKHSGCSDFCTRHTASWGT